jgi:hypothetical protein
MAEPLNIDWDSVKLLYAQGVPKPEICKRYDLNINTLSRRISRGGWTRLKQLSKQVADQKVVNHASDGLAARGKRFVERMARITDTHLDTLEMLPLPLKAKALREQVEIAEKINKTGRSAYGLDATNGGGALININLMKALPNNPDSIDIQQVEIPEDELNTTNVVRKDEEEA